MRGLDFSSWQALATTLLGLAVVTLIGVGIRLLTMVAFQQRRERMNRQINERLRVLIAAYKTLGGSFTGTLLVDPAHRRDRPRAAEGAPFDLGDAEAPGSERARRIRDAVEAALSDIVLLGTQEQVRLAATAASELVAGQRVHTQALVVSLRAFIREALDLDAIPGDLTLPPQGPARPGTGGKGDKAEGGRAGGGAGGGMAIGGGMAMGGAAGLGAAAHHGDPDDDHPAGGG